MTMTKLQVQNEIDRLVEAGDEHVLKDFFFHNFKKLPEEIQKKVLFAVFAEALLRQAEEVAARNIETEGFNALEKIGELKAAALTA